MRGLTVAHSSRILDSDLARISEKCNLFVTCNPCSHEPTSFVRITFIRMNRIDLFVCVFFFPRAAAAAVAVAVAAELNLLNLLYRIDR